MKGLKSINEKYKSLIKKNYEHRAKDCETCETQGICCTDALQTKQEKRVERLNSQTFGNVGNWLPLPVWLDRVRK